MRCKHETEERNLRLTREKADLTSSLAENEEELQEVMRRYKACVGAVSTDQITIQVRICHEHLKSTECRILNNTFSV